jgi:hypothetical protein
MANELNGTGQAQSQSQLQQQEITISVQSAGDPELERRIFGQVYSAGRQLKTLSAVIEVLLAAHAASDPSFAQSGGAHDAVEKFRNMQQEILKAKSLRDPDRLIRELDALRQSDAQGFAAARDKLTAWLKDK